MTRRGPNGRFLSWGGELAAWLPVLLGDHYRDERLAEAVQICADKCCTSASEFVAKQATDVTRPANFDWAVRRAIRDLDRWQKRRAILLKAVEDLRAVENA